MIKAVGAGEAGMDVELYRKVIESSPVIVLLLVAALVVMWRKLDAKDTMLIALTPLVSATVVVVVGAPSVAQLAVPWVSEWSSLAWLAGPFTVAVWWWSRIEARSLCANRAWTAAWPNAQSTSLALNSFARVTA